MNFFLPKPASLVFLITSVIYISAISFIGFPIALILKPLPLLCLILGVASIDMSLGIKRLILAALGFSLLGDVVLAIPVPLTLEIGIGSFLIAHCFYITLFLKQFSYRVSALCLYCLLFVVMAFFVRILIPLLGALLVPVMVYFGVLMLMVFTAFQVEKQRLIIGLGAFSFLLSDLTLSFKLFVYPQMDGEIFIMSSYFMAQFLLTWGVVVVDKESAPTLMKPAFHDGLPF